MQPVAHLEIDASVIAKPASPRLYGLMTEEINHSYEGGLYAEMVSNRTLPRQLGWAWRAGRWCSAGTRRRR